MVFSRHYKLTNFNDKKRNTWIHPSTQRQIKDESL